MSGDCWLFLSKLSSYGIGFSVTVERPGDGAFVRLVDSFDEMLSESEVLA